MKLGCSQESLFSSPFVTRVSEYAYLGNETEFRANIVKTLAEVKGEDEYALLLLKAARLSEEELMTGYTLVSTVLECDSLASCSLLEAPVSFSAAPVKPSDQDFDFIVNETRKELTLFLAAFVNLFTSNRAFNTAVLRLNIFNPVLLKLEDELVDYLKSGIKVGMLSTLQANTLIRALNEERLGHTRLLPFFEGGTTVKVIEDDIPCTIQTQPHQFDIDPLKEMKMFLEEITSTLEDSTVTVVDINNLITCFNNLCKGTAVSPVSQVKKVLSKQAVLTTTDQDISVLVNSKLVPLTMYSGNFSRLTESQLTDILVYIDSLRDHTGSGDSKFAALQNKVVHELALRRK